MFLELQKRLQYINIDKIDYHKFYTFTYGEEWNEKILTNIDNDEALRIIFVCHVLLETNASSISALWKKASEYVMNNYPYEDLDKLYKDMGVHLGLTPSKTLKLYKASQDFKDLNPLLDVFYKWVFNEMLNNVNSLAKPELEKPLEKEIYTIENKEMESKPVPKPVVKKPAVVKPKKKESVIEEIQTDKQKVNETVNPPEAIKPVVKKPKKPAKK